MTVLNLKRIVSKCLASFQSHIISQTKYASENEMYRKQCKDPKLFLQSLLVKL